MENLRTEAYELHGSSEQPPAAGEFAALTGADVKIWRRTRWDLHWLI
jgi:hypothetical protein